MIQIADDHKETILAALRVIRDSLGEPSAHFSVEIQMQHQAEIVAAIAALEALAREQGQEWVPVDVVELVSGRHVRCDDIGLYIGTGDKLHNALAWPETGKYRLCQRTHAPAPEPLVMPPDDVLAAIEELDNLAGEAIPYAGSYFDGKFALSERYDAAHATVEAWLEQRRPAAGGQPYGIHQGHASRILNGKARAKG